MFFKNYVYLLASLFVLLFVYLGISPVDRDVWVVEITPIVIIFFIMSVAAGYEIIEWLYAVLDT